MISTDIHRGVWAMPAVRATKVLLQPEPLGSYCGDMASDGERGGRGWRGCVEHVNGVYRLDDAKVVDERALGCHRLGAHTSATAREIPAAHVGNEPLER